MRKLLAILMALVLCLNTGLLTAFAEQGDGAASDGASAGSGGESATEADDGASAGSSGESSEMTLSDEDLTGLLDSFGGQATDEGTDDSGLDADQLLGILDSFGGQGGDGEDSELDVDQILGILKTFGIDLIACLYPALFTDGVQSLDGGVSDNTVCFYAFTEVDQCLLKLLCDISF